MHRPKGGSVSLAALYYPYSRIIKTSTLKKAALLFDILYFVDSESWFVGSAITSDKLGSQPGVAEADRLEKDYLLLRSEGLVQVLDGTCIARDHDELLTINVVNDVGDDKFCKLAIEYNADTWSILRDRIPVSLLQALYPGAGTFSEAISLQALINACGDLDRIKDNGVRRFAELRWKRQPSIEEAMRIFLKERGYRYVIGGNPHLSFLPMSFHFSRHPVSG